MLRSSAELRELGQLHVRAATRLDGDDLSSFRLAHLREACIAFHSALTSPASANDWIASLTSMTEQDLAELRQVAALSNDDIDAATEEQRTRWNVLLSRAATQLKQQLPTRTPSQHKWVRRMRATAVGVALLVVVGKGAKAAFELPNLALNKPVSVSSRHPAATTNESAVVDGTVSESYGVHTSVDNPAWVMIDLQSAYAVQRVVIHNRRDGWSDDSLPLVLEVSLDATTFTPVGRKEGSFSPFNPWEVRLNGMCTRYIRVRGDRRGFVALSEIEVRGRP